ncbi:hypothetical protein SNOG_00064 [Parastagonospora nodorum SN15]|uniref:Ubiquitin carboxyl-terminal hydrolase n=1 Tax=Phaeosphaeria nodorum (strain SN15 / ATCC MYA-4574 / FGSC 10173) TaxID=321614 RepID=Q0V7F0_PHANO|nr:hypothetical protein SNOG_00064 [Parastagonospora nodorum SN15]EAT91559.2 hypothetical protein SNOG_00064 [Parastagonospora nodorum SN15]
MPKYMQVATWRPQTLPTPLPINLPYIEASQLERASLGLHLLADFQAASGDSRIIAAFANQSTTFQGGKMNSIPAPPRTYRKHFIPLESNPELFTELIHKLGLSKSLEFQDVLSLDDPDLLAFLPRPAYALILVFPTTELYEKRVRDEDSILQMIDGDLPDGDVLFFKQTINNACGFLQWRSEGQNGHANPEQYLWTLADMHQAPDSIIATIKRIAETLNTEECALALEADSALEKAYAQVARIGDTEAPANAQDEVEYHYICFVKSHENGHVYQLDGDRQQPVDLGAMAVDEDVLSDKCLDVIRSMIASEEGNMNFSLMALVPAAS